MFCSEHEATKFNAYNDNDNNNKSVTCKTKLLGSTESDEKMVYCCWTAAKHFSLDSLIVAE